MKKKIGILLAAFLLIALPLLQGPVYADQGNNVTTQGNEYGGVTTTITDENGNTIIVEEIPEVADETGAADEAEAGFEPEAVETAAAEAPSPEPVRQASGLIWILPFVLAAAAVVVVVLLRRK